MVRRAFLVGVLVPSALLHVAVAWAGPAPASGMQDSFPGCTWGEVKGQIASIWSFSCGAQSLHQRLVSDDALPGFVLKDDTDPKGRVAIRFFEKAADKPVTAVLPAVRAASPGRYTSRCVLRALPPNPDMKGHLFALEPTGAEGKAWAASQQTSKMPDQPCGPLGTAYAGDRYFVEMADDPTHVVFLDMGSEIQIFDPTTLHRAAR